MRTNLAMLKVKSNLIVSVKKFDTSQGLANSENTSHSQ